MGGFYVNYTLRGPTQQEVAAALAGRTAAVSLEHNGCLVVFDEESDGQDLEVIAELASQLSRVLECALLAALNHDESIFWYQLYEKGDLVNEYNSSPDYFESTSTEPVPPLGGDAQRLCAAFECPAAVPQVERILRVSGSFDDPAGYLFASARHGELVEALGLPPFSVGASYEMLSDEDLPEELATEDLVWTNDLLPKAEPVPPPPIPGYYKLSFRAVGGLNKCIPIGWAPNFWAYLECEEGNLSEACRRALAPYREKMAGLGFMEVGFKQLAGVLNPNSLDRGGINFLSADQSLYGQLHYHRAYLPAVQQEREMITIAFTAVFKNGTLSCTNRVDKLPPIPGKEVIRLQSTDANFIPKHFLEQLARKDELSRKFENLSALRRWVDANAKEIFEYRVRHKTWVRMSEFEVERVRKTRPHS